MEKTQVFILHWASAEHLWPNFFALEAVRSIQSLTDIPYELIIVDNYSDPQALETLNAKLPSNVRVVKNDRPSRSVASGRNKVWSLVESDYFVLLHPDVKVTRGWLSTWVAELEIAEKHYGKPCAISPTFLPYPLLDKEIFERYKQQFLVPSIAALESLCQGYGIPFSNGVVHCKPLGHFTDNGHQLMIFAASKWFRDVVGEWDERYTGAHYDDNDMGITAILKGCKNLQSHSTYIHHLQGASTGFGALQDYVTNAKVFIEKWGRQMWDEMESGQLWIRLHREFK